MFIDVVESELELFEVLEFEQLLHALGHRAETETPTLHLRRRLILACFEIR